MLSLLLLKLQSKNWGDVCVGKTLAMEARGPEFKFSKPVKCRMWHTFEISVLLQRDWSRDKRVGPSERMASTAVRNKETLPQTR